MSQTTGSQEGSKAQRLQEIEESRSAVLGELFPNKSAKGFFTFGFTIKDCARIIGESLAEEGLLGWFIHLKNPETGEREVTVSCMIITWEEDQNGVRVPILATRELYQTAEGRSDPADFKVFSQLNPPNLGVTEFDKAAKRDITDPVILQGLTNGIMVSAPNAKIEFLEQHTDWADACFLRRTDIKIMQTLLLAQPDAYNDYFFSGAKVDYNTMHNSKLRVDQFTLSDSFGNLVPDSSKAFTLKAEPIFNDLDEGMPTSEELVQLLTQNVATVLSSPTVGMWEGAMFPAAVMGTPCPDFWDYIKELSLHLNVEDPETAKALVMFGQGLASKIEQEAASFNTNGQSPATARPAVPITDIISALPSHPLYSFLTAIINLLMGWVHQLTNYRDEGRLF
jgi:hypothetical protein